MITIAKIQFNPNGKQYDFNASGLELEVGENVIVDTLQGLEFGECVGCKTVEEDALTRPLKPVVRIADAADRKTQERNRQRAAEAYEICRQKIEAHKLAMNLVSVECAFDMNKMLFYFTADGRVDFRELVRELAGIFHTRIELRQIGVRDEARMAGGLGICGRELCCRAYLRDFHPVSINMAKEQNLSLNPVKISGSCGRLMCCLKYEHKAYAELQKTTPRVGSIVATPEGTGKVVSTQMLRGRCKVQLEDAPEHTASEFACSECIVMKNGRGKAHNNTNDTEPEQIATDTEPTRIEENEKNENTQPRNRKRKKKKESSK